MSIRCPWCRRDIDLALITTSPAFPCPHCSREFETTRFDPPDLRLARPEHVDGRTLAAQPCAVHARNAAVGTCDRCGSFMCDLCRITVDERELCPSCFERLAAAGELETARTTFRDFGGLSRVAAVGGCVMWFLSIVLGPLAIYYGIKGLRQKKEMGERDGIVGIWLAMALGAVEIAAGLFFAITLFIGAMQ